LQALTEGLIAAHIMARRQQAQPLRARTIMADAVVTIPTRAVIRGGIDAALMLRIVSP